MGLIALTCPVLSPRAFQRACETSVIWLPGQKYIEVEHSQTYTTLFAEVREPCLNDFSLYALKQASHETGRVTSSAARQLQWQHDLLT